MTGSRSAVPTKGGMSFILAQTLLFQLSMLNGTLLSRINHISLIYAEIKAIVDAKEEIKLSKEDNSKLIDVEKSIDAMRETYEPILDDQEAKQVSCQKRTGIEKLLDLSRYDLLYLTEKYKLVDVRALQEVQGISWE